MTLHACFKFTVMVAQGLPILCANIAVAGFSSVTAQEGTLVATAGHPLVDAWVVDTSADDPAGRQEATVPPNVTVFTEEGTMPNV